MPIIPFIDWNQLTTAEVDWVQNAAGLTYTKGTILIADGDGALSTLAVGTNTHILIADSTQTLGIKWAVGSGGGDVSKVGTPADSQVGVWTGDGTIEGAATLTYDGSNFLLTGDIGATGTKITKAWLTDLEITNAPTISGSAIALNHLDDVTIDSAAVDQVLKYNGSGWINASAVSASGTVGTTFYMDDTEIIGTGVNNDNVVNTLSKFPVSGAEDVDTISVANNTVLGEAYLYNTALGGTTIDPGEWLFVTYASVNSVLGGRVSSITRNIYHVIVDASTITTTGTGTSRTATAASGTPFNSDDDNANITLSGYLQTPQGLYQITGYTSTTVVTIATPSTYTNETTAAFSTWRYKFGISTGTITSLTTNYASYEVRNVEDEIVIVATDKLGEIVFGIGNNTTDIYFVHNGSNHYSNFRTPLVTRHNDLPGLNAGDYTHLSAAQKTVATQAADTTLNGYLATADWDTFNEKADSGANSDITSLTGLTTPLGAAYGGTGVANNALSTLTISGNFAITITVTEATGVTLPASGTLVNSAVTTLSSLTSIGTIATGVWEATDVAIAHGGTGSSTLAGASIPTYTSTNTFTNKRITSRVTTEASSATPTINTDNTDLHSITALATAITNMTTNLSGTPTNGQKLIVRILDNATGRAIAWGTSFEDNGVALPATTTASKLLTVGFIYDTVSSKWGCVAVADET